MNSAAVGFGQLGQFGLDGRRDDHGPAPCACGHRSTAWLCALPVAASASATLQT
jgi:hypothetical protein